jgi:hypothetical protein
MLFLQHSVTDVHATDVSLILTVVCFMTPRNLVGGYQLSEEPCYPRNYP